MKLYEVHGSPNCRKVRIAARELGLKLELVAVDPGKGENKTPDYLGRNPMGKVPTLDDDGFVLWESGAIMEYLASKVPGQTLVPQDPKGHADLSRWMLWGATHLIPWAQVVSFERIVKPRMGYGPTDEAKVAFAMPELNRFVPVLDAQLRTHEYVTGTYSIVDIALGITMERFEASKLSLEPYPGIRAWLGRLAARPAWQPD